MPRFTHPFTYRLRPADPAGPLRMVMWADVLVELRGADGQWNPINCLVDTGASFSVISTDRARGLGLTVPRRTSRIDVQTADCTTAAVVRDGSLDTRFARLREVTFDLLWLFRDDIPPTVEPVLGLHNLIDLFTVTFDGTPRPDTLMGFMEFVTRTG
ncbi:MAG TPA: retropepsin-like aspartic protease [Urbifossiella sp.]|nr:retropepsin-like aspartic protease [Urbifossiella sp.]